jgi:Cu+-exporting ATPase
MATAGKEVTLNLGGLHCAACVARVEKALSRERGVERAQVNLATRRAKVKFDPQQVSVEDLQQAVVAAGYEVESWAEEPPPPPPPEAEARRIRGRFLVALALSLPVIVGHLVPPIQLWLGLSPFAWHFFLFFLSTKLTRRRNDRGSSPCSTRRRSPG